MGYHLSPQGGYRVLFSTNRTQRHLSYSPLRIHQFRIRSQKLAAAVVVDDRNGLFVSPMCTALTDHGLLRMNVVTISEKPLPFPDTVPSTGRVVYEKKMLVQLFDPMGSASRKSALVGEIGLEV